MLISVASIHVTNGSTLDVAKIETSNRYQQMIWTAVYHFEFLTATSPFKVSNGLELCAEAAQVLRCRPITINSILHGLKRGIMMRVFPTAISTTLRLFHTVISYALDSYGPDPESYPFTFYLFSIPYPPPYRPKEEDDDCARSLYLTLKVHHIMTQKTIRNLPFTGESVYPFPVSGTYLDSIRSARSFLILHVQMFVRSLAGNLAARAQGIIREYAAMVDDARKQDHSDDPARLAALTTMLVVEKDGLLEYRPVVYDRNLGTEGLVGGFGSQIEVLSQAIRGLVTLPLKDETGANSSQISALLLLVKSADNKRLQKALREALGKHVLGKELVTLVSPAGFAREMPFDVPFVFANWAAWDCLDRNKLEEVSQVFKDEL